MIKSILSLFLLFMFSSMLSAQTIIDYKTFTSSACNIFGGSVNVAATNNGSSISIPHSTIIGQPTYSSGEKAVSMATDISWAQNGNWIIPTFKGTEYRLSYNFKKDYKYTITVNAANVGGDGTNNSSIRLWPNGAGSGSNVLCTGAGVVSTSTAGDLFKSNQLVNGSSYKDYIYAYSSFPGNFSYLNVTAMPTTNYGGAQTVFIRKITIEERYPDPTFAISPAALSINCGNATSQTFTVVNKYNHSGISGYIWVLASGNGWLYNGSPAPDTIVTTTNTLALTPVCGVIQKNITAIAVVNGVSYGMDTVTVSNVDPVYAITGDASICGTSATYTLTGVPCNATVTWSAIPNGVVSLTGNGNSITATKIKDGSINISATVIACGRSKTVTRGVDVGAPIITAVNFVNYSGPSDHFCSSNSGNTVILEATYTGSRYEIRLLKLPGMEVFRTAEISTENPGTDLFGYIPAGWYVFEVRPINVCSADWFGTEVEAYDCSLPRSAEAAAFNIKVSPNPASQDISITMDNEIIAVQRIQQPSRVRLYDFHTNKIVKEWIIPSDVKRQNLSIRGLRSGQYILTVKKGQYQESKQLLIQ